MTYVPETKGRTLEQIELQTSMLVKVK
jgi:hypothetical protein